MPEELAQRASEELAGYENRFHDLENRMAAGFAEVKLEFGRVDRRLSELDSKIDRGDANLLSKLEELRLSVRSDINLLRWMVTFNLGLSLLILGRLFGVIHG